MRVAVAGAGVAGLAAAAFLGRQGHEITVYDRFPAPRPVGSGLMIQPVGLAVLAALGLAAEVEAHASPITRILGQNGTGRAVLDVRYAALRPGARGLAIQRSVLFDLLLGAARAAGARLAPATEIAGVELFDGSARPVATTGPLAPADLVLDCLGAGSALCPVPSRPLAYGALWALLDWPAGAPFAPDHLAQRYRGASVMAGVLPVGTAPGNGAQKLTFFWSLRGADHAAWRATPLDAWKAEVVEIWPETRGLLAQIARHDDLIFAQYAHRTLRRPGRGRLAHLGDSFHATSPQLGQGANMALLDAAALATALAATADPAAAVARYARLRRWHVRLYQGASWLFTPFYQSDSRILPWLRDRIAAPLAMVPPAPKILAALVAGEIARPLRRLDLG